MNEYFLSSLVAVSSLLATHLPNFMIYLQTGSLSPSTQRRRVQTAASGEWRPASGVSESVFQLSTWFIETVPRDQNVPFIISMTGTSTCLASTVWAGVTIISPYSPYVLELCKWLIGEVVQSRRRPLLGPSPGWKRLLPFTHLRHYAKRALTPW